MGLAAFLFFSQKGDPHMKLEYGLLVLFIGLIYGIIKQFFPDFPVPEEYLLLFVAYALAKLGVELVNKPIRSFFARSK
jgi:hypothetical protein